MDGRSNVSVVKVMAPLRHVFGWKKAKTNHELSFGHETSTPKKSNTRSKDDVIIGKQITIKLDENIDAYNVETPKKKLDEAKSLERRRIRWKKGLELTNNIKTKIDLESKVNIADLSTKSGSRCVLRYEGSPRRVRYPFGDGTWPTGWCQREIVWLLNGSQQSCDVIWFTPLRKKALHGIRQVGGFVSLLFLYDGDEEKAYRHLLMIEKTPFRPHTVSC